jgi:prepilin-type N-terminal cleavage/methylation domain-containing protein
MHARRPGFTMLELLLAVALGALVILATLGVFFQIDRTETLLSRRAKDANELSNLRLVIERVTSNFVMSTDPLPARDAAAEQSGSRFGATRNARDPSAPAPVPRLILEPDPVVAGATMLRRGGVDWNADATRVQRLEVVVSDSPVPEQETDVFARARARMDGGRKFYVRGDLSERRKGGKESASGGSASSAASGAAKSGSKSDAGGGAGGLSMKSLEMPAFGGGDKSKSSAKGGSSDAKEKGRGAKGEVDKGAAGDTDRRDPGAGPEGDVAPVRAVRGAFELRPQEPSAEQWRQARARGEEPEQAWQMWWVPLPPRENGSSAPSIDEVMEAGEPFLIASNLRYVQWTMFDDNEHKSAMNATWEQQLPAHIEVAVETVSGLNANWMFEVDWGRGPEVPPKPTDAGAKQAQPVDPASGGGGGAPADGGKPPSTPTPIPAPPVTPIRPPANTPKTSGGPGSSSPATLPSGFVPPGKGGKGVR